MIDRQMQILVGDLCVLILDEGWESLWLKDPHIRAARAWLNEPAWEKDDRPDRVGLAGAGAKGISNPSRVGLSLRDRIAFRFEAVNE
jgi:hypothetical protein